MTRNLKLALLASASLSLLANAAAATTTNFDNFTPLTGSVAGGSLPETAPFLFGNPNWRQVSIADRTTQLNRGQFNSGNWDMNAINATGPDAGRYLFTVFETGQAGIQRLDLRTGVATTIYHAPVAVTAATVNQPNTNVAFDASLWTPWGTYLTAEESWTNNTTTAPSGYGRLFEVTNPLADPADVNIVHRNVLPRVSHEGLQFDAEGNFYFIDEQNSSHIFRYTSTTPGQSTFFEAGQTFVLRVNEGTVDRETGPFTWVPLTDVNGVPLPGTATGTDPNGLAFLDGRATPNLPAFRGTNFDRPEDLQLKTLADGSEVLYVATTTTHDVYALNLTKSQLTRYVDRSTINLATGLAVGNVFTNPDNLAIDAAGNIYVVEDQPGGFADIWFSTDANNDGVADSIALWASLSTLGSEPTGLFFDPFRPNVAYVNVQHPDSFNDRTIRISAVPLPASGLLLGAVLGAVGFARRRKAKANA